MGLTDSTFKIRFNGHSNSFRHLKNRHETTLSNHIWDLKLKNIDFQVSWKIISKARSYSPTNKICNLCNREVYFIIYKSNMATLNKKNELMSHCRHRAKFKLSNQDWGKLSLNKIYRFKYLNVYLFRKISTQRVISMSVVHLPEDEQHVSIIVALKQSVVNHAINNLWT